MVKVECGKVTVNLKRQCFLWLRLKFDFLMLDNTDHSTLSIRSWPIFTVISPYLGGCGGICFFLKGSFKNSQHSSLPYPLATTMSPTPATTILSSSSSGKVSKPITEDQPPPSLSMSTNPNGPETTAMRLRGGFMVRHSLRVLFQFQLFICSLGGIQLQMLLL